MSYPAFEKPVTEGTRITVLHVDDSPALAEVISEYLEQRHDALTVLSETDPTNCLEILKRESIDCVVSDYQMPAISGLELLRRVREEYPNLPFILFTGKGSEEVAAEAIASGVTGYLQKKGTETYDLLWNQILEAVSHNHAARQAKLAQNSLYAMFERVDGFYAVDSECEVTYWNRHMAERTGHHPEEVIGKRLWDRYPEIVGTEVEEQLERVQATKVPCQFEAYIDAADSWQTISMYPVPSGVFVHSRDISDSRERFRELERRNQRLESVARTLSHDLRNPLNVAEGRLKLAQDTGELSHLEEAANAHNRMQNLINELLRLARSEEMEMTRVPLRQIVEEAWLFTATAGASLDVEWDEAVEVSADETQLQRVFENLFENAIEHGEATAVYVGPVDGGPDFYVEDDGVGIPALDDSTVFESGVTTKTDGTGYGLAIVKQIATEHGWDVSVTEADEGGARFEFKNVDAVSAPREKHGLNR